MSMSSGSSTSSTPTIDVTDTLPSLTPPSTAMCEWQSMMPGMTNLPAASITVAPLGHGRRCADRGDLAVADEDRALVDRAVRDGQDRRVANDGRPGRGAGAGACARDRDRRGPRRAGVRSARGVAASRLIASAPPESSSARVGPVRVPVKSPLTCPPHRSLDRVAFDRAREGDRPMRALRDRRR